MLGAHEFNNPVRERLAQLPGAPGHKLAIQRAVVRSGAYGAIVAIELRLARQRRPQPLGAAQDRDLGNFQADRQQHSGKAKQFALAGGAANLQAASVCSSKSLFCHNRDILL